jgi:NADP-dependent 3-hydroxy acid dehydrogenase YdfG
MTNGWPRVWLVTGASTGFGHCIAEEALSRGERVAVTARDPSDVANLAARFPELALPLRLDVTESTTIATAVAAILDWAGKIDVLVNNAGRGLHGAIEETSDREAREIFETNVFGLLNCTRAVLPSMRQRRSGHVINIGSVAALAPGAGSGLYAATKAAVQGISEAMRAELLPLSVHVTLVEPGPFRTDFGGRSITVAETTIPDYAPTAGERTAELRRRSGQQVGDPRKGAVVICDAVDAAEPPMHLVLGSSAIDRVRAKIPGLLADITAWEKASRATEFGA